jgi:hypothetical protein
LSAGSWRTALAIASRWAGQTSTQTSWPRRRASVAQFQPPACSESPSGAHEKAEIKSFICSHQNLKMFITISLISQLLIPPRQMSCQKPELIDIVGQRSGKLYYRIATINHCTAFPAKYRGLARAAYNLFFRVVPIRNGRWRTLSLLPVLKLSTHNTLTSSLISKACLKSDYFRGGGSVGAAAGCGPTAAQNSELISGSTFH